MNSLEVTYWRKKNIKGLLLPDISFWAKASLDYYVHLVGLWSQDWWSLMTGHLVQVVMNHLKDSWNEKEGAVLWLLNTNNKSVNRLNKIPKSIEDTQIIKKVDDRKTNSAEKLECVQTCMIMQSQSKAILIWDESMKFLQGYHIR